MYEELSYLSIRGCFVLHIIDLCWLLATIQDRESNELEFHKDEFKNDELNDDDYDQQVRI